MNIETHTVGTTPTIIFNSPAQSSTKGEVGSSLLLVRNESATATVYLGGDEVTSTAHVAKLEPQTERFLEVEVGAEDLYAVSTEASTTLKTARGIAAAESTRLVEEAAAPSGPTVATSTVHPVGATAVQVLPLDADRKVGLLAVTGTSARLGFSDTVQNITLAAGEFFDVRGYTGAVWAVRNTLTDTTVTAINMT